MRMFITSKNKYLSNDMKIFGTCSIPLTSPSLYFYAVLWFIVNRISGGNYPYEHYLLWTISVFDQISPETWPEKNKDYNEVTRLHKRKDGHINKKLLEGTDNHNNNLFFSAEESKKGKTIRQTISLSVNTG